jgi:hypothetical protein
MADGNNKDKARLLRELSDIEDHLADPVLEGREWADRRDALERRRETILSALAER